MESNWLTVGKSFKKSIPLIKVEPIENKTTKIVEVSTKFKRREVKKALKDTIKEKILQDTLVAPSGQPSISLDRLHEGFDID